MVPCIGIVSLISVRIAANDLGLYDKPSKNKFKKHTGVMRVLCLVDRPV